MNIILSQAASNLSDSMKNRILQFVNQQDEQHHAAIIDIIVQRIELNHSQGNEPAIPVADLATPLPARRPKAFE